MVILISVPSGSSGIRHVAVSLPRIDALIADQPTKYALPESGRTSGRRNGSAGRMSHDDARFIERRLG